MSGKGYFEHCTKCHPEIDVKWPVVSGVAKTGISVICYSCYLRKKKRLPMLPVLPLLPLLTLCNK